jgi:DNA-directed RNA polymerase specialized sigma subunit
MPARGTVASINGGGFRSRVLAIRNTLVETHLYLVPPIAGRLHLRLPPSFELADLISEGHVGLIRAATRYRPGQHNGTPFSAFARTRIHGAMVDSVRRRSWAENSRNPLEDAPEPITAPRVPYLIKYGIKPPERFRGGWTTPFPKLPKRLRAALRRLPSRQQAILGAFYADACTVAEVAALFRLTQAQALAEHDAALDSLRIRLVRNLRRDDSTQLYFEPAERAA